MINKNWIWGQKKELAERVGKSKSRISNILSGRQSASPSLALRIEEEAHKMGLELNRYDVLYPNRSDNPLMNN